VEIVGPTIPNSGGRVSFSGRITLLLLSGPGSDKQVFLRVTHHFPINELLDFCGIGRKFGNISISLGLLLSELFSEF